MKLEATIVLSLQAPSLADAGEMLDDVLRTAAERDGIDVQSVQLQTPTGRGPVTLPQALPQPASPPRRPITNGSG